ncbi:MAG: SDR family NAD(P)-dependent oxidoreductase [Bacteroidales bacterium]|nr:SDR family NAD(P)-dependent oxidoreductase [Bacteroidales bacterium]
MKTQETYTLITGASMGLGRELATECARRGHNLLLVALPGSGLWELRDELKKNFRHHVECYECDLSDEAELEKLAARVTENYSVDRLINNAGVGGTKKFEDASSEYLDLIIHLNIRATTMLTRLLLPELKRHRKALIMNVSSLAAFGPLPYKTIYPASKAFIYSFSRGLSRELHGTGVSVVVVAPGPFISNADVAKRIMKQSFIARLGVLSAREITLKALKGAEKGQNVIIPGIWNRLNRLLMQLVPEDIRLSVLSNVLKRELPLK